MPSSLELGPPLRPFPRPKTDPVLSELASESTVVTHPRTTENDFDRAMRKRFATTGFAIITELVDSHAVLADRGIYSRGMFHAALKEIMFSHYIRVHPDEEWGLEGHQPDTSMVHTDLMNLLEYLTHWPNPSPQDVMDLDGNRAELTIYGLGTFDNPTVPISQLFNLRPTSMRRDIGRINAEGKKTGVDIYATHLPSKRMIPTQVKKGETELHEYNTDTLVISAQRLAGGRGWLRDLESALIAKQHREISSSRLQLIESAQRKLLAEFTQHLSKAALSRVARQIRTRPTTEPHITVESVRRPSPLDFVGTAAL